MSRPDRLVSSSDSEIEVLLLRAARESAPPGAKERAAVGAASVLSASTLGASKAAGAVAGKVAFGAKSVSLVPIKWAAVVGLVSLGAATGTVALRVSLPHPPTLPASNAGVVQSAAPLDGHGRSSPKEPASAPDPLEAVPPPLPSSAAPRTIAKATPPQWRATAPGGRGSEVPGSTAAAELAVLDEARAAMADRDPARALAILESYGARFPRGVLGPEATVLRIEALLDAGDAAAAKRAAEAFLRASPESPYTQRIESILRRTNL
jgi:hypothetical protein